MTSPSSWTLIRLDAVSVRSTRERIELELERLCSDEAANIDASIVLGELLANACQHGKPPIEIRLQAVGARIVISVRDAGDGIRPPHRDPSDSIRGRGLRIVGNIAAGMSVDAAPQSHVRVELAATSGSVVDYGSRTGNG